MECRCWVGMSPSSLAQVTEARFTHHRNELGNTHHFVLVLGEGTVIADVSEGVQDRLGFTPEMLIGNSFLDYVHPADQERAIADAMRELVQPESLAPALLIRVRHADGSWRHIECIGINRFSDPQVNGLLVGCRDITSPHLNDRVAAADNYLYRALATSASDGTTIFDAEGRRVYSSPSILALLGYSDEEFGQLGPSKLVHPDDLHLWKRATKQALRSEHGFARVECRLMRHDGQAIWIETTVVNLLEDETVRGVVAHIRNIHDRRSMEAELRRQASTDNLTGLGNRSAFMSALREAAEQNRSVLFCDLDGFKAVNDRFGHDHGDQLLACVGNAIRVTLLDDELVARIGGDEFCVLIPSADGHYVHERAQQIQDAVLAITRPFSVGISIGIATAEPGEPFADVLSRSDRAMYRAKHMSTNLIEND
jgi:diguanylate cyclase (GGDEF)-like protein/PAS domain S-box-containing protein